MPTLPEAVAALTSQFTGRLLLPSDAGYESQRRVHNGSVDRRPGVIALCAGTADIVDAVGLATSQGLELSVRGGGHNVAGQATLDDGVMIDLSTMRSVHVDAMSRTAWVGGGSTWKEFNRETQLFGLAATGGVVSSTGVAGLTLGGGFGWLMPKHGMAHSITCGRSPSCWPTVASFAPALTSTPISSGPFAGVAATSA